MSNQAVKEECEKQRTQIEITLNTLRGEKQASDRIVAQLRQDLQSFSSSTNTSQSKLVAENSNLKSQFAVVNQQLQDCKNQNAQLTSQSAQFTRIQVELNNCQTRS